MRTNRIYLSSATLGIAAALLLTACDGGPSNGDLIAACKKEGEGPAQKSRDRQMGVNRDAFCQCAAKEAKANYSTTSQRAVLLFMEGKKAESREIVAKMSDADQQTHMKVGLTLAQKCIGGAR